jgi:hypothetical protein
MSASDRTTACSDADVDGVCPDANDDADGNEDCSTANSDADGSDFVRMLMMRKARWVRKSMHSCLHISLSHFVTSCMHQPQRSCTNQQQQV